MSLEGDGHKVNSGVRGVAVALTNRGISEQVYNFNNGEWKILTTKSTILASACYCHAKAQGHGHGHGICQTDSESELATSSKEEASGAAASASPIVELLTNPCQVCKFSSELKLHHYPEMVFPDNILSLVHPSSGFVIEFNALDAMRLISTTESPVQVACSQHWKATRAFTGLAETVIEPFDWTFSTDYQGTLRTGTSGDPPQIETDSQEKLDLEKLKQREAILFYDEMTLYEDELHDNGVSNLTVKIRVMPSGFFILLRFFLRVDGVLIKFHDTRIHFEVGNCYFLRQFQTRQQSFEHLEHLEGNILGDPNLVYQYVPVTQEINEKIMLTSNFNDN